MQSRQEFRSLLQNLTTEIQDVSILWQLGILLVCLGMAWFLQKPLSRYFSGTQIAEQMPHISSRSAGWLLFPFIAMALVAAGKWGFSYIRPPHLLEIAIPLLFSLAMIRLIIHALRRGLPSQAWLRPWERAISWSIWIWLALHITGVLPDVLELLDSMALYAGKYRFSVPLLLQGILAFAISIVFALWLGGILESRIMLASSVSINQRIMLSKLVRTLLALLGVLIALQLVGVDITVLSVFGGALGVGLGLGLQKIASNYVSGFIILMDRSLHPGDMIMVDNHSGIVTSLTNRYVVLRGLDGVEAIVPNDTFITSTVTKQNHSDSRVRLALTTQISYDSDLETAMSIMLAAAKKQPRILSEPSPQILLKEFADNGIVLELGFWINDPGEGQSALRSDVNMQIWNEFRKHDIRFPFPQREVRIMPPDTPHNM